MKEQEKHILLRKLQQGNIQADEYRKLELLALDDDFLFEAIEGYQTSKHKPENIDVLRQRLLDTSTKKEAKRRPLWLPVSAVAATMIGFLFLSWWMMNTNDIQTLSEALQPKTEKQTAENEIMSDEGESNSNKAFEQVEINQSESYNEEEIKPASKNDSPNPKQATTAAAKRKNTNVVIDGIPIKPIPDVVDADEVSSPGVETSYSNVDDESIETEAIPVDADMDFQDETIVIRNEASSQKSMQSSSVPRKKESKSQVMNNSEQDSDEQTNLYPSSGIVFSDDREALIGATITIPALGTGTITDLDGLFTVNLPEGVWELHVDYTGYESMQLEIVSNSEDNQIFLNNSDFMEEVVVTSSGKKSKPNPTALPINGWNAFNKYIRENSPLKVKGQYVDVEFTVTSSGKIKSIKVVESSDEQWDSLAIKLLEDYGEWETHPSNKRVKMEYRFEF